MEPLAQRLRSELDRIRAAGRYRTRRVIEGRHGVEIIVDGRRCLNFCSNDYLGLAADPRLAVAARRALDGAGTGSGASALISGYNAEHRALEEALAEFTGRPRALLFSSGWAANLGVLRGLLGRDDVLLADDLNHASLIDGGRLSGAEYRRIAHADVQACEAALRTIREATPERFALIVSDSVFSMDGDLADLPALAALGRRYGASLMVDDAHGFGVLGQNGRGAPELLDANPDIYVATLGKAVGAAGAFVAGSEALIEYLVQRARSLVFSTAPPPAIAAAAREGLRILREEPQHRERLQANVRRFTTGAAQLGLPLGPSGSARGHTPILPLLVGREDATMALSARLYARGYWVAGIRPPTVPRGTSRLRITLSAAHGERQIDGLLEALAQEWASVPRESAAG